MRKEMDGKVFVSRQSWRFSLVNVMIKVLFSTFCVNPARKNLFFSMEAKVQRGEKKELEWFFELYRLLLVVFLSLLVNPTKFWNFSFQPIQSSTLFHNFSVKMADLRNKRKLTEVAARDNQERCPRSSQSRSSVFSRTNERYFTQVSEKIEVRVTKNLSQDFSTTKSLVLGALFEFDEFLLNVQVRVHSGLVPGTSRRRMT